jgi:hypothetical protein
MADPGKTAVDFPDTVDNKRLFLYHSMPSCMLQVRIDVCHSFVWESSYNTSWFSTKFFCSCPLGGGLNNSSPITENRNWAQRCHIGVWVSLMESLLSDSLPPNPYMEVNGGKLLL